MSKLAISLTERAYFLRRTLGLRCAAGFLRNRDVSLEDALRVFGFQPRF
jgi:hypothetical protein